LVDTFIILPLPENSVSGADDSAVILNSFAGKLNPNDPATSSLILVPETFLNLKPKFWKSTSMFGIATKSGLMTLARHTKQFNSATLKK
jgi:hypothetical protein